MAARRGPLSRAEIERYLRRVGTYLDEQGLIGEILLVGGAYMTLAGRPEDIRDLRALRAHLGLASADEALAIVTRYIPERFLTARVRYLIEDLFDEEEGA